MNLIEFGFDAHSQQSVHCTDTPETGDYQELNLNE